MRLLVVDTDQGYRQKLEELTSDWGYSCHGVETVSEALDILGKERIDVIISDWSAPGIDGPELCRKVRALQKTGHIYFIICSEKRSTEDMVKGIDEGADDYVFKPIEHEVLRARLKAGMRLLDLDRSLLAAKARLERGLTQAARTLKTMLPDRRNGTNFRIDWLFRPCAIIGGDLFNVVDLDDSHFCIYAIDVSGHEVGATLFAVTLGHMLLPRRKVGKDGKMSKDPYRWNQNPVEVVSTLNERFQMAPPLNLYATLFYAVIDRRTLVMSWVRAGHPSPIVVRRGHPTELTEGDLPIGVLPDSDYTLHTTQLERNDRLFIYSDGITETKNISTMEMLGARRFIEMMTGLSDRPLDEAIAAIDAAILEHRVVDRFDDDLSLLAVEIK
jgi:phosphoserine phosphatase RsbU/P